MYISLSLSLSISLSICMYVCVYIYIYISISRPRGDRKFGGCFFGLLGRRFR